MRILIPQLVPKLSLLLLATFALSFDSTLLGQSKSLHKKWEIPVRVGNPQALVVSADQRYLFAALKDGGISCYDLKLKQPKLIVNVPTSKLKGLDVMNIYAQGDFLFAALGSFFDSRGDFCGLAVLSVKNPNSPKVLSVWKSKEKLRGSAVVIADKKFAYLGAMDQGVFIFDISKPSNIKRISVCLPDVNFHRKNHGKIQHPNARGLVRKANHLFVANDAGGIRVVDVSNPKRPTEIAKYINKNHGVKQQAYNNLQIDGNKLYAAVDYAGLEILDISNIKRIRQFGWWNPWNADANKNFWFNSPGHTNQLVFDRRSKKVYLSAGDSELVVVDVSNPAKPKQVQHVGRPKNKQGVWGLALSRKQVYLAYIKTLGIPFQGTWAGIRAFDRD